MEEGLRYKAVLSAIRGLNLDKEEKGKLEPVQITLAAARVNAGMTQDEVAKKMKVGKRTIINWEKGLVKPSFASLNMLSELYEIPINNIFLP